MRFRAGSAAVVAFLTAGCSGGHARAPEAPMLRANGAAYVLDMTLATPSHVGVYGLRAFTAAADLTIESVAPARLPAGVTVLAARVAYLRSAAGHRTTNGYPGGICTDRWPPAGFGPTDEVGGAEVRAGDVVAFTLFVRAARTGTFDVDGYDVTFRDAAGVRHHARDDAGSAVRIEALAPGQRSAHHVCAPTTDSVWLN